jgi:putative chitinase
MDYEKVLLAVCPHGWASIRKGFAASMDACIAYADMSTPRRLGMFIGQCAEESAGFRAVEEYASGRAYEGRKDLGNVHPGDGVMYKGRGMIELTGYTNYADAGRAFGQGFVEDPQLVSRFPWAALVSAWFWKEHDLNRFADIADDSEAIREVTHRVNGGYNGLSRRAAYVRKAWAAMADLKGTLLQSAKEQQTAVKKKTAAATATTTAAAGSAAGSVHPTVQASGGAPTVFLFVLAAAVLAGLTIVIIMQIKKHQNAATALTEAAKGV